MSTREKIFQSPLAISPRIIKKSTPQQSSNNTRSANESKISTHKAVRPDHEKQWSSNERWFEDTPTIVTIQKSQWSPGRGRIQWLPWSKWLKSQVSYSRSTISTRMSYHMRNSLITSQECTGRMLLTLINPSSGLWTKEINWPF